MYAGYKKDVKKLQKIKPLAAEAAVKENAEVQMIEEKEMKYFKHFLIKNYNKFKKMMYRYPM